MRTLTSVGEWQDAPEWLVHLVSGGGGRIPFVAAGALLPYNRPARDWREAEHFQDRLVVLRVDDERLAEVRQRRIGTLSPSLGTCGKTTERGRCPG